MSAKSKLTLSLLGATAFFTFNPGLISSIIHADEKLSAEELSLEPNVANGLDALTGAIPETNGARDSVNSALAPSGLDDAGVLGTPAEVSVRENFVPGENPFVATTVKAAVEPQASAVSPDGTFSMNAAVLPAAQATQDANPFKDPAEASRQAVTQTAPAKVKVDDSALRYYAAGKDLKRLGSEMRRLQSLYPGWQPPKDLFSPVANVNEQPLWDTYKSGDYAAVRARIALMQSSNPKWQPSDDLLLKLQMAEARTLINRAYAQKRWQQVISTAQASPSMMVCGEMQVLWNVGEAFARTRNYAESFELYKYIVTNCDDSKQRLATVQKASALLPPQGLTSLIAFGRTMPDGGTEFENVGFDGLRRQLGEFIQHGDFTSSPSDDDLKRFVDFVQRTGSSEDAGLIGWYFYSQEEWKTANSWFIQAAQYERTPKNIEGVILTLRNMDQPEDALKLARRYMKTSPEIAQQYIEVIASSLTADKPEVELKDKEIADFEKVVADNKSALGAQALGWKYLNADDKEKAQAWFADSVAWKPTEGGVVGLAVMAARAKNYSALATLKAKYSKEYASLDDFKIYKAIKNYKKNKKQKTAAKTNANVKKKRLFLFQSDT